MDAVAITAAVTTASLVKLRLPASLYNTRLQVHLAPALPAVHAKISFSLHVCTHLVLLLQPANNAVNGLLKVVQVDGLVVVPRSNLGRGVKTHLYKHN